MALGEHFLVLLITQRSQVRVFAPPLFTYNSGFGLSIYGGGQAISLNEDRYHLR